MKTLKDISKWQTENSLPQCWRMKKSFELISDLNFKQFIEFGADTGYFTAMLDTICDHITAIDLNKKAIEFAKKTKKCKSVNWIISNMLDYKFESKYDGISFLECLYYLSPKDRSTMLTRSHHHLKQGGTLLVGAPLKQPEKQWRWDESYYFESASEIKLLLEKHGFKIVKTNVVVTRWSWINNIKSPALYNIAMFLFAQHSKYMARNIVILAKK